MMAVMMMMMMMMMVHDDGHDGSGYDISYNVHFPMQLL